MKTYAQFQPTGFDRRGAFLPERQDWFVVPVSRNRDSGPLYESNFEAALKKLGGESETVEVHRFGHWGPGWFEIIIVAPGTKAEKTAQEIEGSLENYPVLDEDDFSAREWESASQGWDNCSLKERVDLCREAGISIFAARREEIPSDDSGYIFDRLRAE